MKIALKKFLNDLLLAHGLVSHDDVFGCPLEL